ncbi:MAG: 5-(carboxyamino)imidazole ribonucleotide synthase [Burkholderiales bacterium]|nr:5-(carboxyamino)imidazole ribonucleotide synthase [Burkholderiales bacterium]MDE1926962.1 5-(carboxyamino)imidazole ribonucleotide synthase [Burkholderiales bacterium]MDE2157673.1 5-(carboxyamino)imidazole ribonucleotide synthase [Burkholderiales bacterium]MDE2503130.1 5-(carboxyamino)imidazole ribonucleotide synthase [Burkholderiales bacterium]
MTPPRGPAPEPALERGRTLGVLGGGQLGRMFVHAAQVHGYAVAVLEPDGASPAGAAAESHLRAAYTDAAALAELARRCVAVTTEFENVPAASLRGLAEAGVAVAPPAAAVEVCQHRAREKRCFAAAGVPCAPHAEVVTAADAASPSMAALLPGLLKTSSMGYDGKGQVAVDAPADLARAWAELGGVPCLLERRLELRREISVIVARGRDGAMVHLPVQQNLHRDGILAVTQVPAPDIDADTAARAVALAERLAAALDYVGVLCVEFFVLGDGSLVANEMAPRPHNSGHYSIDACDLSQFDLQVRTLAGLPLTAPRLHSPALMLNLLGDLWLRDGALRTPDWAAVLALPGTRLHLYGKSEPRRGRKMGHLTVTAADPARAREVALLAADRLGLPRF